MKHCQDDEQKKKIQAEIKRVRLTLEFFPRAEKYVSLYKSGESGVRTRVRRDIENRMDEGRLDVAAPSLLKNAEKCPLQEHQKEAAQDDFFE
ncbi:hypothetical protein NEOLI_003570 [Neolecta irregularis DAH-3]|uniref:rRNA-processing protein efg1 n=1 Tax=Neolecta irregularis (strain DAH-3) TaxID=1198029 RepID=A0A1U7LTH3_NEOID|nr:hypothetical protein NEOLI_003570 [Neolecta irregularis DAH-3]|eukprot:OLL25929.1 hypothetical protein NEOLI_003570 [Neolecta irregularis DAH-3]